MPDGAATIPCPDDEPMDVERKRKRERLGAWRSDQQMPFSWRLSVETGTLKALVRPRNGWRGNRRRHGRAGLRLLDALQAAEALKMSDEFEVLAAGEMRAKYGLTAENRPRIILDAGKVPAALRHLIPLAERFGVSDDLIRQDILAKTTPDDLEAMRQAVRPHEDAFDAWLAGSEAYGPGFSDEYLAFTCLRMAADGF